MTWPWSVSSSLVVWSSWWHGPRRRMVLVGRRMVLVGRRMVLVGRRMVLVGPRMVLVVVMAWSSSSWWHGPRRGRVLVLILVDVVV
ncbi:hypothetical protein BDZ89DRAFT_1059665 [Hymenopellis radicata]|nr:hypothetical protein BDZ89DRAFT_1059665 [Hymenopellis radicata]